MWFQLVAPVVAVLSVVATAGLLAEGTLRSARRARELSELHSALPAAAAQRDQLAAAIDVEVARTLEREARRRRPWSQRADDQLPGLALALVVQIPAMVAGAQGAPNRATGM